MPAPVGNSNASKNKRWQKAIERALARLGGDVDKGLDRLADKVVAKADEGDKDSWREVAERMDGKAAQVLAGDSDNPLTVHNKIERAIVYVKD